MSRQRISQILLYKSWTLLERKSNCSNILLDLAVSTWDTNVKYNWRLLHFLLFQRYQQSNWEFKTVSFKSGLYQSKKVWSMLFCFKKNVLVINKNFWNWRLKANNMQNFWDHYLEQFIQTVKRQKNFLTCSWRFRRSNKLEQLEFKLEKNIGI